MMRFLSVAIGLIGIAGSFYIENIQGEVPCALCLMIRYSIILFTISAILSLFYMPVIFAGLISLIPGVLSDINLIISENFSDHTGLCGSEQKACTTPEFFGLKVSIWGLIILFFLFALSVKLSIQAYRQISIRKSQ